MSEEMAVSDNAAGEDAKLNGDDTASVSVVESQRAFTVTVEESEDPPTADAPSPTPVEDELISKLEMSEEKIEDIEKAVNAVEEIPIDPVKPEPAADEMDGVVEGSEAEQGEEKRGVKRRASIAFNENSDEGFKGFDTGATSDLTYYNQVLERLEAEVSAASKNFTPVRNVMATPSASIRASKRARQDTDGSRPSSALSSRSDELLSTDGASAASSPAARGRRATTEMSSPLLRVPLEKGWKRELVHRAALDQYSRRNADIYYYTPKGKKLRSTREIAENLAGTGLTLENFSFFKEPLGVDDPEKEIIRDARPMHASRTESPVAAVAPVEGKRTPKPKQPKGVSPDPVANSPLSPPSKIKVKSMGSRLQGTNAQPSPAAKAKKQPAADNNNTAAWKKPRPPPTGPLAPQLGPAAPPAPQAGSPVPQGGPHSPQTGPAVPTATPPPPLQGRPQTRDETVPQERCTTRRQVVQPCSLTCGRGVPSLACAACLCLYHPACVNYHNDTPRPFYCKNCRKSQSPPVDPPPLTHKSGVTTSSLAASLPAPVARRPPVMIPVPVPVPIPVPVPKARPEKRVLLRMKAATGGPEGERVWAVAQTAAAAGQGQTAVVAQNQPASKGTPRPMLPQALVALNNRRFILVPRSLVQSVETTAEE